MAEDRPGARLHTGRAGPHTRRAHSRARCARGVRGIPALLGAGGRPNGGADLAPILDGTHGRPDHRAPAWQGRGAGVTRTAARQAWSLRGTVYDAGGRVPLNSCSFSPKGAMLNEPYFGVGMSCHLAWSKVPGGNTSLTRTSAYCSRQKGRPFRKTRNVVGTSKPSISL